MKRRRGSQPEHNISTPSPDVDEFFDRALTPDAIESLLSAMDNTPSERVRFDETQSMLDDLRAPVQAPDLSGEVLAAVGDRRGWLSTGQRRLVFAGRLATAACLLLVVVGMLVMRRHSPEAFNASQIGGPVSEMVETSGAHASAGLQVIGERIRSIEMRIEPAVEMAAMSASSCDSPCARRSVVNDAPQDYSLPLSPGVGQWLSANNSGRVMIVMHRSPHGAPQCAEDASINRWMIAPQSKQRLNSYSASAVGGAKLLNVTDWTVLNSRE